MFSKPKDNVYHSRSVPAAGWKLSTLTILIVIIVFLISLLIAYYLGLRAGKNSGLELAHENSLAQVMRMPVSKAVFDKLAEEGAKESTSDIYQELSKTKQDNNAPKQKIEEVSQQVKEILKPTATAAQGTEAAEVVAAESTAVQLAKGKQENVDAIRQALEQVNPQATMPADKKDPAVRVINPSGNNSLGSETNQPETKKLLEKNEQDLNRQEKFTLQEDAIKAATPTAKAKPTTRATATPLAKKTATPAAVIGATKKLESGWYAQVAAPKSLKEAQTIASSLKKAGLKAEIESAEVGDQQYFRVVVGPSNSRLAAEQNLSRLRKQSSLKAEPFVRLVR